MRKTIAFLLLSSLLIKGYSQVQDTLVADSLRAIDIISSPEPITPVFKTESIQLGKIGELNASLDEAIEKTSIHLRNYGPGQLTSISLRGTSAAQTTVLWNGVNINSPTLGQADLSMIPLSGSSAIEIRYGNANRRDGFGGIGGSVNLTSSLNDSSRLEAIAGISSFSTYEAGVKANYKIGTRWLFSSSASLTTSENNFSFRDYTQSGSPTVETPNGAFSRVSAEQHALLKLKGQRQIKVSTLFTQTERQIPPSIGVRSSSQAQSDHLGVIAASYLKSKGLRKFEALIGYRYGFLTYTDSDAGIHTDYLTHGIQGKVFGKRKWGKRNIIHANALFSADWAMNEVFDQNRLQTRAELGYERIITSFVSLFAGIQPELLNDSLLGILPTIGAKGELLRGKVTWLSSWSRNVRSPTLNDLYWQPGGNENLRPEKDETFELGLNYKSDIGNVKSVISVTGFFAKTKDLLVWVPTGAGYPRAINQSYVERKGVETTLLLSHEFGKTALHLNASGTFVQTNNENGEANIYIPDMEFRICPQVSYGKHSIDVSYRYTGERFTDVENTTYLPAFDLIDLNYVCSNIPFSKQMNISVSFGVHNLLDKKYMVMAGRPMPGRNYRLLIKWNPWSD
jgi:iron complex outermembrane receptor protein